MPCLADSASRAAKPSCWRLGAPVSSGTPIGHRSLGFQSVDDLMSEVDRLVQSELAGRLRRVGNWTLGQALGHLAAWAEYSYIGTPLKVPIVVKWLLRLRKRHFLYSPMRAGIRIPGVKGGTLATEPVPVEKSLVHLRQVMARLKCEAPMKPDVFLGPLNHQEWIAFHLRHAELHLGFFIPE
jgi:hypothetical protein